MFSALRLPAFLRVDQRLAEALPFPTLVYIPASPTARPGQQNARASGLLGSPPVTSQTETRSGQARPLRSVGRRWTRGLSCILPCDVIRCKHVNNHFSLLIQPRKG